MLENLIEKLLKNNNQFEKMSIGHSGSGHFAKISFIIQTLHYSSRLIE
jgi:hypothetical protein